MKPNYPYQLPYINPTFLDSLIMDTSPWIRYPSKFAFDLISTLSVKFHVIQNDRFHAKILKILQEADKRRQYEGFMLEN